MVFYHFHMIFIPFSWVFHDFRSIFPWFLGHSGYIDLTCQVTPESLEDRSMTLELDALDALGIAGIADAQVGGGGGVMGWDLGKGTGKPRVFHVFFVLT